MNAQKQTPAERVLQYVKAHPGVTGSEIYATLRSVDSSVTFWQITKATRKLLQEQRIKKIGKGTVAQSPLYAKEEQQSCAS